MSPGSDQGSARSRPSTKPKFIQFFDIDNTGNVTHHPNHPNLVIPYDSIFDTPGPQSANITISKDELSEWASYIFAGLN